MFSSQEKQCIEKSDITPVIISIEGNIGSGKSTLVHELKQSNLYPNSKVCYLLEPVDEWNKIADNNGTIIEKYYKDQKTYAFQFQMMAYISRLKQIRNAVKENYDIIITERSVMSDKNVFAKMLYDDKILSETEYAIYNEWYNEFITDIPDPIIIYLKTEPTIALSRVKKRNRPGENIPLDYLEKCSEYHNLWLLNKNNIVLDGNNKQLNDWIRVIKNRIMEEVCNRMLVSI
jgi:deoxyadenosine/deoxycytidine kinase